jgi:hypothetical protein
MTIYLSGPMTGHPEWNYPAFHAAAQRLRTAGHDVFSPAENFGGDVTRPRADHMRKNIEAVLAADAVAVLPGWEQSKGARLEVAVAREIGTPVVFADTLEPCEPEVLFAQV